MGLLTKLPDWVGIPGPPPASAELWDCGRGESIAGRSDFPPGRRPLWAGGRILTSVPFPTFSWFQCQFQARLFQHFYLLNDGDMRWGVTSLLDAFLGWFIKETAVKIGDMNQNQRQFISDKLGTLGNIGVGAMIFGQFLSDRAFSLSSFSFGLVCWLSCYIAGYLILKGGDE